MRKVGIYIDENKISVAISEKNRFVLSKSMVLPEAKEEGNSEEVKAAVMRIFEEASIDTDKINLGLSGKNIIFRLLNFPALNRRELEAALPLEAEKYMPFKIKEVIWGYRYKKDFRSRKIYLAFLAERRSIIENYVSLFESLGVKIETLESGFLSLYGFFVGKKYIPANIPAVAFINLSSTDMEIAIFEKQFPYFSRYSKLPLDDLGNVDNTKIVDDIRLTFDYYKREFHKDLTPVPFVVTAPSLVQTAEEIKSTLSPDARIFTPSEIMPEAGFEDLEEVKAFSLAARDISRKQRIFLNLPLSEEEAEEEKISLPVLPPLNPIFIVIEVIIGISLLGFSLFKYSKQEGEILAQLHKLKKDFSANYPAYKTFSYHQMKKSDNEYSEKIKALQKIEGLKTTVYQYLKVAASSLTPGLWFKKMSFTSGRKRGSLITIEGYVFLDDRVKERKSIGDFLLNLRNNAFVKERGPYVNLNLVAKSKLEKFTVTKFKIEIRGRDGRL